MEAKREVSESFLFEYCNVFYHYIIIIKTVLILSFYIVSIDGFFFAHQLFEIIIFIVETVFEILR